MSGGGGGGGCVGLGAVVGQGFVRSHTVHTDEDLFTYRKILKISPGAYILQRPFLRGLLLEGLIFGGAYLWREICV